MSLLGGTARVRATLMRPSVTKTDTAIWLIRSDAVTLGGNGIPAGRRTVAQFAYRVRGRMQVLSTWTTLSGLIKAGSSGIISGADVCGTDTLAGVALPDSTYTQNGAGTVIYGNPPINQMGTQTDMADSIKIDWAGISDPVTPLIQADYIVCLPGTVGYDSRWAPCTGWPTVGKFASDSTFWPVVIINGSYGPLPEKGRGTLIVTGDLTFGGSDDWEGIILVGQRIIDNGSGYIAGAVVTGLDVMKGMSVGQSSKALGTKDYFYDSCAVENAANNQSKLVQVPNAWVDNWTAW